MNWKRWPVAVLLATIGAALTLAACAGLSGGPQPAEEQPEVAFEHPEFILSAEQVNQLVESGQPNLVLLDARGLAEYEAGHLPGAVHLPPSALDRETSEVPFEVLSAEEITPLLQAAGIRQDSHVVIYDQGGTYNAARVWWILDYYQHPNKAVMDGGFAGWQQVGGEVSTAAPEVQSGDFEAVPDPAKIADYDYVLAHIGTDATSVCDARRSADYAKGAIPGAVNVPYDETFAATGVMSKDAADLQEMFSAVGLERDEEIIFYCIGGYLSSQDFLLARALGYQKVRLYDGSIIDWNERDGPTEPGTTSVDG